MTARARAALRGAIAAFVAIGAEVGAAVWGPAGVVLAAEPAASPGIGGDPRSPGQGPGLVGDPLMAIGVVLAVGLLSLVLTVAWVRLTDERRRGRR